MTGSEKSISTTNGKERQNVEINVEMKQWRSSEERKQRNGIENSEPPSTTNEKTKAEVTSTAAYRKSGVFSYSATEEEFLGEGTGSGKERIRNSIRTQNGTAEKSFSKDSFDVVVDATAGNGENSARNVVSGTPAMMMEVAWDKGDIGLGFCIEGGIDSPLGDVPITVKRLFKGSFSNFYLHSFA